jgi:hypothetical protein
MAALRPEHPHFDGPPWQEAIARLQGWSAPREIRLTTSQPVLPERFVDYVASISWIAAMPDGQRAEMLARIDAIVAAGETPSEMPVHVVVGLAAAA